VAARIPIDDALALPVRSEIVQMRFEVKGDGAAELAGLRQSIDDAFDALLREHGVDAHLSGSTA
jgi:hypothetical protein